MRKLRLIHLFAITAVMPAFFAIAAEHGEPSRPKGFTEANDKCVKKVENPKWVYWCAIATTSCQKIVWDHTAGYCDPEPISHFFDDCGTYGHACFKNTFTTSTCLGAGGKTHCNWTGIQPVRVADPITIAEGDKCD